MDQKVKNLVAEGAAVSRSRSMEWSMVLRAELQKMNRCLSWVFLLFRCFRAREFRAREMASVLDML